MFQRKLHNWQNAGLIDSETANKIIEYESQNSKPYGLWAVIALGALAIGLGFISLIAANWDALEGVTKLAIHFTLLIGIAGWLFWPNKKPSKILDHLLFRDAILFIFGALGLTFFGHLGQVYQTSSPLWQPLLLWLILFLPIFLLLGRGWLSALAWIIIIYGTSSDYLQWYERANDNIPDALVAVLLSICAMITAIAAFVRGFGERINYWRQVEQIALISLVIMVGFFHLAAETSINGSEPSLINVALLQFTIFGFASAIIYFSGHIEDDRDAKSRQGCTIIVISAAISNILAALNAGEYAVFSALIFMGFWAVIALASLTANWRTIFQLSVAVIAVRLIILSFQLASDLLGSGIGLILCGLLALAVAWIAVRFSKKYAPEKNITEKNMKGEER